MKEMKAICHNMRAHDSISDQYENMHEEIFNQIEQGRLQQRLTQATSYMLTSSTSKLALDYGCGSGNLTKHLWNLGFHVVAADVSKKFLSLIGNKYGASGRVDTIQINGYDLSQFKDESFDFVAFYSVLHHIPDYLKIISEVARVIKRGGVCYLDHEVLESYWNPDETYTEFLKLAQPKTKKGWKRFFRISKYINKLRYLLDHKYQVEGDIHVWPDDHIEWDKIESLLVKNNCEVVFKEDYLLYQKDYLINVYNAYKDRCGDSRLLVLRKR